MGDLDTRVDPRIGTRLANRYSITERVDAGGMATVYRARDEILNRDVAIKIMHPALAADPSFVERFRAEGQNAARLSHPNICTVYDYGETDVIEAGYRQTELFMVMEFVDGTTLRSLLDRFGRLDAPNARHVARGVAAALDHAHSKSIIHRDVKPENVLLTPNGEVKVVDFGIAKALGTSATHLTTDRPIGTVAYVAPEQLTNGNVDRRADVYALGALTYEMLTGRAPFSGDTPSAVAASRLASPTLHAGINPDIDAAIAKATSANPEDRFDSTGAFAHALGEGGASSFISSTAQLPDVAAIPAYTPPAPVIQEEPHRDITEAIAQVKAEGPVEVLPFKTRLARRRGRNTRIMVIIAAILVVAAIAAYAVMPKSLTVPDLRGQEVDAARSMLSHDGLKVGDIEQVFHDVVAEGDVVRTSPEAGTAVKKGVRVTLMVSSGPQLFDVPKIVGKPVDDATNMMSAAGFSLIVGDERYDDTVPKGAIVSYGPPSERAKKGTAFTAIVSKGPELVAVPNVSGKTPEQSKAALEAAGFTYAAASDYSDTVPLGQVIRTNPAGGEMAPKGSTITSISSKGPRPFPMPNLLGMSLAGAKAKAASLGLVVRNTYPVPGSGKSSGTVQGQNPTAGTEVRKGTSIDLYYAN